jgi:hypothetical protein
MAEFENVSKQMVEWIKQKTYRAVSVCFNPDLTVEHVGVLGGIPPAVSGLADFQFSKNNDKMEYTMENKDEEGLFTRFVNWMKEKKIEFNQSNQEKEMEEKITQELTDLKAKFTALETEKTALTAQVADLTAKFAAEQTAHTALKAGIETAKTAEADKADAAFCDAQIAAFRMRPVDKAAHMSILKAARNADPIEFSAADGKPAKKSAVDAYKETISKAEPFMDRREFSKANASMAAGDKDALIVQYRDEEKKANPSYSTAQATLKVFEKHPELR